MSGILSCVTNHLSISQKPVRIVTASTFSTAPFHCGPCLAASSDQIRKDRLTDSVNRSLSVTEYLPLPSDLTSLPFLTSLVVSAGEGVKKITDALDHQPVGVGYRNFKMRAPATTGKGPPVSSNRGFTVNNSCKPSQISFAYFGIARSGFPRL